MSYYLYTREDVFFLKAASKWKMVEGNWEGLQLKYRLSLINIDTKFIIIALKKSQMALFSPMNSVLLLVLIEVPFEAYYLHMDLPLRGPPFHLSDVQLLYSRSENGAVTSIQMLFASR